MGKQLRGKNGQYAGSVGDGKNRIPAAQEGPSYDLPADWNPRVGNSAVKEAWQFKPAWEQTQSTDPTVTYEQFLVMERETRAAKRREEETAAKDAAANNLTMTSERDWNSFPHDSEDFGEEGNEYTYEVTGELADRIRQAFGVTDSSASVTLVEDEISFGEDYSRETTFFHEITCAGNSINFDAADSTNGLVQLLRWLDEKAPRDAGG